MRGVNWSRGVGVNWSRPMGGQLVTWGEGVNWSRGVRGSTGHVGCGGQLVTSNWGQPATFVAKRGGVLVTSAARGANWSR